MRSLRPEDLVHKRSGALKEEGVTVKRVMFCCQHVLGMGHLVRSSAIVGELARNFSVLLVSGGRITDDFQFPESIQLFQLPALEADADFSSLHVCDSSLGLEETKARRCRELLEVFDRFNPDALITELYPFGRKQFTFELVPLLERAHNRSTKPLIVSSVRDILVTKKDQPKHERRVCKTLNKFYDLVLIHSDESFQKLEGTFSRVSDLCCAMEYTGYVVKPRAHAPAGPVHPITNDKPAIVVSNGSGGCPVGNSCWKVSFAPRNFWKAAYHISFTCSQAR